MTKNKNTQKAGAGRNKKNATGTGKSAGSAVGKAAASELESSTTILPTTKFEDAFDELEQIVETLEDGDQPLQDSLQQFERGIGLARFCQQSLADAEQRVMILSGDIEQAAGTDSEEILEAFELHGSGDS